MIVATLPLSVAPVAPGALRLLVIEDDDAMRDVLCQLLEHAGHQVLAAPNGAEGIRLARCEQPEVIFCDVNMPGLSGHEVLRCLQDGIETRHIPFIFLTGCLEKESIRIGMAGGASEYISKPFQVDELTEAISACRRKVVAFEHACEAAEARLRYA